MPSTVPWFFSIMMDSQMGDSGNDGDIDELSTLLKDVMNAHPVSWPGRADYPDIFCRILRQHQEEIVGIRPMSSGQPDGEAMSTTSLLFRELKDGMEEYPMWHGDGGGDDGNMLASSSSSLHSQPRGVVTAPRWLRRQAVQWVQSDNRAAQLRQSSSIVAIPDMNSDYDYMVSMQLLLVDVLLSRVTLPVLVPTKKPQQHPQNRQAHQKGHHAMGMLAKKMAQQQQLDLGDLIAELSQMSFIEEGRSKSQADDKRVGVFSCVPPLIEEHSWHGPLRPSHVYPNSNRERDSNNSNEGPWWWDNLGDLPLIVLGRPNDRQLVEVLDLSQPIETLAVSLRSCRDNAQVLSQLSLKTLARVVTQEPADNDDDGFDTVDAFIVRDKYGLWELDGDLVIRRFNELMTENQYVQQQVKLEEEAELAAAMAAMATAAEDGDDDAVHPGEGEPLTSSSMELY